MSYDSDAWEEEPMFMGPDGYSDDDNNWPEDPIEVLNDFAAAGADEVHIIIPDVVPMVPDPFNELNELVAGERMEAEIALLNAVEDLLALGASAEDVIALVQDRL